MGGGRRETTVVQQPTTQTTQGQVAPEFRPAVEAAGRAISGLIPAAEPLLMAALQAPQPQVIPGPTPLQRAGAEALMDQLAAARTPIFEAPAVRAAQLGFEASALPLIQQQAVLAGTGRGGAPLEAIAQAERGALLPVILQEEARREAIAPRAFDVGEALRAIAERAEAAIRQEDLARRALAEQAIFGTTGQLIPATALQQATGGPIQQRTTTRGGGFFK